MKELKNEQALHIVEMFLEKLEKMTSREREVLIVTIELLNHPVFVTTQS